MTVSPRASLYERITADIVVAIERGAGAFRMPWHHDGSATSCPVNAVSLKPYRGVNVLALWAGADAGGYPLGLWATYRQWTALGAQVRKGEHATLGVVWKTSAAGQVAAGSADQGPAVQSDGAASDDAPGKRRLFAGGFSLFNVAQVDGYAPPDQVLLPDTERIAKADAFVAALDIPIVTGGDMAFYRPSTDTVHLPPFKRFFDAASAAAVAIHECAHATGAPHRLARDLSGRFGSRHYAMEECCAEVTASFVLADLGIAHHPRPDHAAYIATWLAVLKDNPRAIFTAASKAQQAADWMRARQPAAIEEAA